jgi:hypothetical protein
MTPTQRCIDIALSEFDVDIEQSCDEIWHDLTLSGLSEDMQSAWMQRFYVDMRELRDRYERGLSRSSIAESLCWWCCRMTERSTDSCTRVLRRGRHQFVGGAWGGIAGSGRDSKQHQSVELLEVRESVGAALAGKEPGHGERVSRFPHSETTRSGQLALQGEPGGDRAGLATTSRERREARRRAEVNT